MNKRVQGLPKKRAGLSPAGPDDDAGPKSPLTDVAMAPRLKDREKLLDGLADRIVTLLDQNDGLKPTFKQILRFLERCVLVKSLNKHSGNQRLAARFLCLKPTTLFAKLRKHKIQVQRQFIDASYPSKGNPVIDPDHPIFW